MLSRRPWTFSRLVALGLAALFAGALAVVPSAMAQEDTSASSGSKDNGGAWLLEPVGARAMALQAYTPLADDAAAVSLNPAGLANLTNTEVLFYTRESTFDAREHYLSAVWPDVGPGTLGVAWRSASVGDSDDARFIATDSNGNDLGTLGWKGNALEVGYGYAVDEDFQIGGSLGLVFDKFSGLEGTGFADDESGSGFRGLALSATGKAADVVRYGVTLRNLGGSVGGDTNIPVIFSAGAAVEFPRLKSALLAVDFEKQFVDLAESTTAIRLGGEYHLDPIALRLGTSQSADRSRWFAGFGISIASLQMDYAFQFINRSARGLADVPRHFVSLSYLY